MPMWTQRTLGGAVLAWALLAAILALKTSWSLDPDPMAELQAAFHPLASELPNAGTIGYLQHYQYAQASSDIEIRRYYAAQYALAPRVIVLRTGPEYLIVATGTVNPQGDARLDEYVLAALFPNKHRVYRRRQQ